MSQRTKTEQQHIPQFLLWHSTIPSFFTLPNFPISSPTLHVSFFKRTLDGIEANFMFAPLANNGGAQVWIEVKSGLTKKFAVSPTGGFEYHIHVKPVGPNNDCVATGGHLDPGNVGAVKCTAAKPDTCQEGDLSGTWPFLFCLCSWSHVHFNRLCLPPPHFHLLVLSVLVGWFGDMSPMLPFRVAVFSL